MGQMCCNARPGKAPAQPLCEAVKTERKEDTRAKSEGKGRRRSRPRMKTLHSSSRPPARFSVSRQSSDTRVALRSQKSDLETKGTDISLQSTELMNPVEDLSPLSGPVPDTEIDVELLQIESLSEEVRDRLATLVSLQTRAFTSESEDLEGYIVADVTMEHMQKQKKYVVVSSFSIYFVDILTLRVDRKLGIGQIELISVSPEKTVCLLHIATSSADGDIFLSSSHIPYLLPSLEIIYHESTKERKYIPCVTLESSELVQKRMNTMTQGALLAYHTSEQEKLSWIFVRKGQIGENKVYLKRTKWGISGQNEENGYVLVSSLAVYLLLEDWTVKEKYELEECVGVVVVQESEIMILQTKKVERLLTLNNSFTESLDRALQKRLLPKLQVTSQRLTVSFGRESNALIC